MCSTLIIGLSLLYLAAVQSNQLAAVSNNVAKKIALEVLRVSPGNTAVSSLALRFPLCTLAYFARGTAKLELMSALGYYNVTEIGTCYSAIANQLHKLRYNSLLMTSKLYYNDNIKILPAILGNCSSLFRVALESVAFGKYPSSSLLSINHWIERATLRRITNILDEDDVNNKTSIVVVQGIHYKFAWHVPFNLKYATEKIFDTLDGKKYRVPMMTKVDSYYYLADNNLKMVGIIGINSGLRITFIMPMKKGGISELVAKLLKDPNMFARMQQKMKIKTLSLSLPRIKIKTYVDWTDFLKLIGINSILNPVKSGLEGILEENTEASVHLNRIKQKMFLDIDEYGPSRFTEQSPFRKHVRESEEDYRQSNSYRFEQWILDRPFYFVVSIRDSDTMQMYELINGIYYGPQTV